MNIMTNEELDRQRVVDSENVISSLQKYKDAKASLRKARITSISNKILAPYRRFKISLAIAKYDAMIEKLEKERERAIKEAEKLQEKEEIERRRQAKADFKEAVRDKRKEDVVKFVEDVKSGVKEFGNNTIEGANTLFNENLQRSKDTIDSLKSKGVNVVNSASCFMINVKTSLIATLDKKTTLHRDIEGKILNYRENKANRDYEKAIEDAKARQIQEEINNSIAREREFSDDVTIRERFNKINKNKSYMGTATNRVVDYFRSKKNKLDDKIFDAKVNMAYANSVVTLKASRTKSKIATAFNSQINNLKNKADNFIGNTMVAASDTYNNIREVANNKMSEISSAMEHRSEVKQRKEDMISAINEEEKKRNAIREEQLKMRRDLTAKINNGDIFGDAAPVVNGSMRR